jgi:hypothetical protein
MARHSKATSDIWGLSALKGLGRLRQDTDS